RDERQFGPARRADTLAIDRLAAGHAQRRQRDVEREFWKMRERVAAGAQCAAQVADDGAWWWCLGVHRARLAPSCATLKSMKCSYLPPASGSFGSTGRKNDRS